jgi:phosphomannomutase
MDYKSLYVEFQKKFLDAKKPLTVVFDASNGPAGSIVKEIFRDTNINAIVINDEVDPDFKAHGPNPLLPGATDNCKNEILKNSASLGIIFDADGDRAIFLDDRGEMIPACFIAGLIAQEMKAPYVVDEMVYQSIVLLKIIPKSQVLQNRIGAYFMKERMREAKASFGAEYSGHYYFEDFFGLDTGILAGTKVINALSKLLISISEWQKQFGEHKITAIEMKIEVNSMQSIYESLENEFKSGAMLVDKIDGVTFVYENAWINVRASNTEPILRVVSGGNGDVAEKSQRIRNFVENLTKRSV